MWARGYFRCSRGNVTDEIIAEYIAHHQEDRDADFSRNQDLQSVTRATAF